MKSNARRRLVSWIASFAVLLNALAPGISQAIGSAGPGAGWFEICSALGTRYVQLDDAGAADQKQQPGTPGAADKAQCPFCLPHAGSFGLAPIAPVAFVAAAAGHDAPPRLFFTAPRPLFQWAPAHSRAPPFFS